MITCVAAALLPTLAQAAPRKDKAYLPAKEKMNVLFILADDLRPDLGCYSDPYAITPNMDALASRGVVFANAYCQQAVSNPSRASMLTGMRPDQIGVTDLFTNFRDAVPQAVTLPQLFKNNGYYTAGTGKIFHAVKSNRDEISWNELRTIERRGYLLAGSEPSPGGKGVAYEAANVADNKYPDGEIADNALQLIKKASKSSAPFFIAVGFLKPHLPFNAPKRYWDMYRNTVFDIAPRERPAGSPALAFHNSNELRGYVDIPGKGPLDASLEQELWRGYYACISYVDAQIGKLLEALDTYGMTQNTIVVVWGDHGYHLGEQDLWCKSTNFELDTRVPLIISVPGGEGMGKTNTAIVETVDLYPTLADYCLLPQPSELAGRSLKGIIRSGANQWEHYAYSQFVRPYGAISNPIKTHMGYSVRTPQWRFTAWYNLKTGSIDERELYLLGAQGIETRNLAGNPQYAQIEKELLQCVDEYKNGNYSK